MCGGRRRLGGGPKPRPKSVYGAKKWQRQIYPGTNAKPARSVMRGPNGNQVPLWLWLWPVVVVVLVVVVDVVVLVVDVVVVVVVVVVVFVVIAVVAAVVVVVNGAWCW